MFQLQMKKLAIHHALFFTDRLSTVRNADKIFVVSDGRVVEEGSHTDLLEKHDGAYASLIQRQMQAHDMLQNGTTTGGTDAARGPMSPPAVQNGDLF
jgi:ABC-type transport system involved in cytochrome bd biosynthesis fused ATPase/permease subunit